MSSKTVYSSIQKIIAILLIIEGGYYLGGIIATLIIRHLLFLDFRCLLILLGIYLWTNGHYARVMAIAYYLLALVYAIFLKADTWFLVPDTTNILYVIGLIPIRRYSEQALNLVVTVSTFIRVVQLLLLLWLAKSSPKRNEGISTS